MDSRLAKRIGAKKATVAAARKLAGILQRMRKDGFEKWASPHSWGTRHYPLSIESLYQLPDLDVSGSWERYLEAACRRAGMLGMVDSLLAQRQSSRTGSAEEPYHGHSGTPV